MAKTDETLASGDLLVVGVEYYIKLTSGKVTRARYNGKRTIEPYRSQYTMAHSKTTYRYDFKTSDTNRNVSLKSKQKIQRPV